MMQCHAAKIGGGWVGQTFALAKPTHSDSDSGSGSVSVSAGKKSRRLRISKDDRKALVQSFINRYQSSNNGNFPSLNLTHKEVGGSFYTVREIVREIIQENRVLGPPKLTEDEQEVNLFHDQYPLGSISRERQSQSPSSLNGIHAVSNDHKSASEELDTIVTGRLSGQQLDSTGNGKIACQELDNTDNDKVDRKQMDRAVNGKVDVQQLKKVDSGRYFVDKEFTDGDLSKLSVQVNSDGVYTDIEIKQTLEPGPAEDIGELPTPTVTPIATDVVVETFPIISSSKTTKDVDGRLVETGNLEIQQEIQAVEVKPELVESLYFGPSNEIPVEEESDQLLETLSSSNAEGTRSTSEDKILQADVTLQTTNKDLVVARMELKPAVNNVNRKNSNDRHSNQGESLSHESAATKSKSDNQYGSADEGKISTLNRTKLESWQESSRTAEAETNPVLAVVKAFITAFVKFWTE